MKVAAVRDVSEQIRGVTYAKSDASAVPRSGYSPMLRANNIGEHGLLLEDLIYVPNSKISPKQRIVPNDVVVAASSGSISVVGKTAQARSGFDGGFGAFCKVLRPGPNVDPHYFGHYFKTPSYRRVVSHLASGANINNLRKEHLDNLQIPVPPLAEQNRIAGILDATDALRAERREALAQLDTLLQSIFLDMFGDPVINPMGWEASALSEVTDEIYRYPTYFGIVYEDEGVPEIRGELIGKGGKIDTNPSELRFIAQATSDKFPRTQLAAGDLVMSVRGTIGKIGIVPAELANANMTANLIRISPARSIIDPVFLLHVALGPYFINKLSEVSSSTTIKTIKALDLKAIPIPLPSLKLQRRFSAIVEFIENQKDSQRAHLSELDTLFASLQFRAFRGEL